MLFVILLTLEIIIGVVLVGLILLQRSEGGALGIGGGGGGGGFMSARGAGNFLTRATSILAMFFFVNAIALTIVSNYDRKGTSVIDQVGEDSVMLDEAAVSAAAASRAAEAAALPSLTELPAPTQAAPTLGTRQPASASSASATSSSAAPAPKPAAKPAAAPVTPPAEEAQASQ